MNLKKKYIYLFAGLGPRVTKKQLSYHNIFNKICLFEVLLESSLVNGLESHLMNQISLNYQISAKYGCFEKTPQHLGILFRIYKGLVTFWQRVRGLASYSVHMPATRVWLQKANKTPHKQHFQKNPFSGKILNSKTLVLSFFKVIKILWVIKNPRHTC